MFILYLLGLVSFTLYPMPDNPAQFCESQHLNPQLLPMQFIRDIMHDGAGAVLQVVMNMLFFVPLGMFAKLLFGWKMRWSLVIGFVVSLTIEAAQLTGVFGLYPCSYRLFDVDDLMINTLGAIVGYGLTSLIPVRNIEKVQKGTVTIKPGLIRLIVTLIVDLMICFFLTIMITLAAYLLFGRDFGMAARDVVWQINFVVLFFVIPYLNRGKGLGGYFTRLSFDNHSRKLVRRTLYYLARFLFVAVIIFAPHGLNLVAILITLIIWRKRKKLPYQFL